jgi:phospholipase/lecithinase/hemolysin
VLDGFELASQGMSFERLDLALMVAQVMADPDACVLTNVGAPRLSIGAIVDPARANPDEFLFWDGWHPTTAVPGILSAAAVDMVGSSLLPELAAAD